MKISSRQWEDFSPFDTFCQYLKSRLSGSSLFHHNSAIKAQKHIYRKERRPKRYIPTAETINNNTETTSCQRNNSGRAKSKAQEEAEIPVKTAKNVLGNMPKVPAVMNERKGTPTKAMMAFVMAKGKIGESRARNTQEKEEDRTFARKLEGTRDSKAVAPNFLARK